MTTSRITMFAAIAAAISFAGCGRDEQKPSAVEITPEEAAYRASVDDVNEERKSLMTAMTEAQKSGDQKRIAAAAEALARNRKKAADLVRAHMNLSSSKENNK